MLGYLPNDKEKIKNGIQEIGRQNSQRTQVKNVHIDDTQ